VLIPSPRVTDSRQKFGFLQTLFYLFGFSVVFQNKIWWRFQTLFLQILFLVRHPVASSVAIEAYYATTCYGSTYCDAAYYGVAYCSFSNLVCGVVFTFYLGG